MIEGDLKDEDGQLKTEDIELWRRNPVECLQELLGNSAFREHLQYGPIQLHGNGEGTQRIYDEMWTGEWWWETQVSCRQFDARL